MGQIHFPEPDSTHSDADPAHLVVELDVHPARIRRQQLDGADAADRQGFQHGDASAAGLAHLFGARRAFPPLVILLEQVERLPGGQDRQRLPNVT